MILIRDEGDLFDGTLDEVWGFVGSGDHHSTSHRHRGVRRESHHESSGSYSWEQEFEGSPSRFTMRWTMFPPLGIVYEVLEGPFTGSTFFLYYTPRGDRTEVGLVGAFASPGIPESRLEDSVRRFFAIEFDQDQIGLAKWKTDRRSA
jgi:hypothetical protein